jgi:hypothetical protein
MTAVTFRTVPELSIIDPPDRLPVQRGGGDRRALLASRLRLSVSPSLHPERARGATTATHQGIVVRSPSK